MDSTKVASALARAWELLADLAIYGQTRATINDTETLVLRVVDLIQSRLPCPWGTFLLRSDVNAGATFASWGLDDEAANAILTRNGHGLPADAIEIPIQPAGAPGGALLWVVRLVVGSAMVGCVVLGVVAARREDVAAHRAWMIRAYALAVAAGTQVFTQGVGQAVSGTGELSTALSTSAGWVLNLAIAEWVVQRPVRRRRARGRAVPAGAS